MILCPAVDPSLCSPDLAIVTTDPSAVVAGTVSLSEGSSEKGNTTLFDKGRVEGAAVEARREAVASEMDMFGALTVVCEIHAAGICNGIWTLDTRALHLGLLCSSPKRILTRA